MLEWLKAGGGCIWRGQERWSVLRNGSVKVEVVDDGNDDDDADARRKGSL